MAGELRDADKKAKIGIAVAFVVGCLVTGIVLTKTRQTSVIFDAKRVKSVSWLDTLEYGNPEPDKIESLAKIGIYAKYDSLNRNPKYVCERLTKEDIKDATERAGIGFFVDPTIPGKNRATAADYDRSGYDRGHMAPAGNHSNTMEALRGTFTLANVVPQNSELNRGLWKKLETQIRNEVEYPDTEAIWVVTGPLYLPDDDTVSYKVIGKNQIGVPTHVFKSILKRKIDGTIDIWSFLVKNEEPGQDKDVQDFQIATDELEKLTGYDFWNLLPGKLQTDLEKRKPEWPPK